MGDSLRGWKRKTGIVTLTFACLFAGGWIRSSSQLDVVTVSGPGFAMCFATGSEMFGIFPRGELPLNIIVKLEYQGKRRVEVWSIGVMDPGPWDIDYRSAKGQLANARPFSTTGHGKTSRGGIPYWTAVVPLVLVSAWLLLSRPRANHAVQ